MKMEDLFMEKKKMKLWQKIIFIVLAIAIIVPTVLVIVNTSVINKIIANQKENVNMQNYSYTVQSNSTAGMVTKVYYKDGIKMYVVQNNENNNAIRYYILTRPPKVRPKKSNFGGRYFYVKIQL